MLEIEEAVRNMTEGMEVCKEAEEIHIEEAYGRILSEDIYAPMSVPHFPKSAMDGYAVRALDTAGASKEQPVTLKVDAMMCAGEYVKTSAKPMHTVRVMTGSLVPEGYDAVIKQEDTDYGMDSVQIFKEIKPFMNYCKIGEDIQKSQKILEAGTKINSLHIGILASLGIQIIKVIRRMRVAIISTGTELTRLGQELKPACIYNSISYVLSAKIKNNGLEVMSSECCIDEIDLLAELIEKASETADVIITTGAVSVGKKDIIPATMEKLGAKQLFRDLNIQPGTPTQSNLYNGKILLDLSGNPYAAIANFEIFFWEAAAAFYGDASLRNVRKKAVLKSEYKKVNKLRRLVRARYEDGDVYIDTSVHSSSVISNLKQCNCFIDFKENTPVTPGDTVNVILIKD